MSESKQVATKTGGALMQQYLNNGSLQNTIEKSLGEQSGAFCASLIELYGSDKYLKECDPKLVIAESMKAVALKLPIVKAMGLAYIVAFRGVPTLQIGYKGFLQLAMRTGEYKFINAGEVYEGEFVKCDKLTGEVDISGARTGDEVTGFFAYIETRNGFTKAFYWTTFEVIDHAKKYSKMYPNGVWKTEFNKMAVKTVLRNLLSHYGYLSVEMISALDTGDERKSPEDEASDIVGSNANSESFEPEYTVDESGDKTEAQEVQSKLDF